MPFKPKADFEISSILFLINPAAKVSHGSANLMTEAGCRKEKSVQILEARPVESQQPAKKCMRDVFKKNKKQTPVGGELLPANSLMAICHNVTGKTL